MKKQFLTMLIVLISAHSFGQISFEKGYYIDNSDKKIDCYIKNIDWKNNPTEFQYKLTETSEKQTASMANVKAFEILNGAKYERYFLAIDTSNQDLNNMDSSELPQWENKELFLKVLVEGKVSLYSYVNGNVRKYFIKEKNGAVDQLLYKKYMATNSRIAENNEYRRQLWGIVTCGDIQEKVKNVTYTRRSLTKIVSQYNKCEGGEIVDYEARIERDPFHIAIKPGINFATVKIDNSSVQSTSSNPDFESQAGFQLGVEFEYVLNFNKNKWALVAEPTYISSYSDSQDVVYLQTSSGQLSTEVSIEYAAIEIPVGFRYYSFLSDNSKLFFDAFYMFNITLDSNIKAERSELLNDELEPKGNLAFGAGYKYKDKYSIAFRYRLRRELYPTNSIFGNFDYHSFAVIFGYTLF